jgi:long-chain acyl-CoA synthetase
MGKELTYEVLLESVNRFANALVNLGVKKGDRVSLYMPNTPHMVIAYYAVLKAGGVVVPTNPVYTERELDHQVSDSEAEVLVTLDLELTLSKVKAIKSRTKLRHVIVGSMKDYLPWPKNWLFPIVRRKMLEPVPTDGSYHIFTQLMASASPVSPKVEIGPDDIAVLMYTGGTTGVAKGAMLTHRNMVSNAIVAHAWATSGKQTDTPQDILLIVLPMFHSFAMTVGLNHGIRRGAKLLLIPKPEIDEILKTIQKYRPSIFPGVPTLYTVLANRSDIKAFGVDSIRICNSGAAPLPVEVMKKFEEVTGAKILEGYGLSEASPVTHCNPLEGTRKPGSIGLPMPDTDARIVDQEDNTKVLGVNEVGEICIKGPQVMKGYWNRPEETGKSLVDGWLFTGDIAKMDEEGYFYIVERKKDLIIAGGYNIYPREVEEFLYEHPKVKEAAVIGIPDEIKGEKVKAFVILKDGETATEEEIIEFCRKGLAPYKVPKHVEFKKELPKSMIGKILRRVLREEEQKKKL